MKFIGEICSYNIVDFESATRGYQGNEVHKIFTNFLWRLSFINQLIILLIIHVLFLMRYISALY